MAVPKYEDMMNPTLQAFNNLGGSASNDELEDAVAKILSLLNDFYVQFVKQIALHKKGRYNI